MEKITINGKEFSIKTTLADVTLVEYNKYMDVFKKKFDYEFIQYAELLKCISDMSEEDIEDMEMVKLKELAQVIQIESFTEDDKSFENRVQVEVNGSSYKTSSDGSCYNFTTKEMVLIKDDISKKHLVDVAVLAGILFKKLDADGNVIRDYSPKALSERTKELGSIPMSYIAPYLLELDKFIKKEKPANESAA